MKLYFSDAQRQLTPYTVMESDQKIKLIHAFMYVHENECASVVKTLYSYILDTQGHLTL